jgi:hypothetical protein
MIPSFEETDELGVSNIVPLLALDDFLRSPPRVCLLLQTLQK